MTALPDKPVDVVIVGMGPVGAAAALFFAQIGLDVAVVEKSKTVYDLPRAVVLDGEIVRAFQRIGLGQELSAILQQVRPGERAGFVNAERTWLFGQESRSFGRNGWPPMSFIDQPELEHFLRSTLESYPNVQVHLGEEVESFAQQQTDVTVTTSQRSIKANWMLACDGAASSVRKTLGINWTDLDYDHEWLVVDVTLNDGFTLKAETLQVCDPARLATYIGTKEPYRRWEFKLNPGETAEEMLDDETIATLIAPWLPPEAYALRRKAVYQFHAATADRWREGRILLAGDAAHQTPPFLGQGLNAGMRDVINLAWKLKLVAQGVSHPSLLDEYEAERMPHAQDLVEWAVALGKLMEHLAATEAAERSNEPAPETPVARRASGYGQGREAPPLRNGVLMIDQVSNEGSTGYLFNQPIVGNVDGSPFKLDELLGTGFALVTKDEGLKLASESIDLLNRLGIKRCDISQLQAHTGSFDSLFEHTNAAIVRPDRYVFGHSTPELSVDELIRALAQKLALTKAE